MYAHVDAQTLTYAMKKQDIYIYTCILFRYPMVSKASALGNVVLTLGEESSKHLNPRGPGLV